MHISICISPFSYRAANPNSDTVKGGLEKYYYGSKDLRLLLDLLAESSGPTASLRVIAQFDTEFNMSFKPGDIRLTKINQEPIYSSKNIISGDATPFEQTKINVYGIKVNFEHADAYTGIFPHMKNTVFMYTIELFEKMEDGNMQKIQVIPVSIEGAAASLVCKVAAGGDKLSKGNLEGSLPLITDASPVKELECVEPITNLDMSKEYTIRVNTMINGKTLGYKTETFGPVGDNFRVVPIIHQ